MPLRRWFSGHGYPGWYSWLVLFLTTLASIGISIVVNATLLERTIEQNRRSDQAQAEQARQASCVVIMAQDDAFNDPAPSSPAGKKAAAAWHSLRLQLRCDHQ